MSSSAVRCLIAGFAAGLLFPAPAAALPAGEPAGLMGPGRYHVGLEAARLIHRLAGDDYETRGTFLKAQGGLRQGLDLYVRLGRERVYIPAGALSSALDGDQGLSAGGGVKIGLPAIPALGLTTFLDLGFQSFRSGGTLHVLQEANPAPIEVELEDEYSWKELQAAWGMKHARSFLSPYAGVSSSWLDVSVTQRQAGGAAGPAVSGNMRKSPLYRGFLGLELRVTPALGLACEVSTQSAANPSFTVALFENTSGPAGAR